jgi:hypothetical protein
MKNALKNKMVDFSTSQNEAMSWEQEVKRFVESRRLKEARKILDVVRPTEANNAALKYWQRVLGDAQVISKTPASGVSSHKNHLYSPEGAYYYSQGQRPWSDTNQLPHPH